MTDERQDGPPGEVLGDFPEDDLLGSRFRKPAYIVRGERRAKEAMARGEDPGPIITEMVLETLSRVRADLRREEGQ